ncbi:MAG: hypothetical protein IT430_16710 [Phycisphaerales bacterium]|nr:hypothetical protein [Phycisphaerales bacterium]
MNERDDLLRELDFHVAQAHRLRDQIDSAVAHDWRPSGFYTLYHIMAGITIGGVSAAVSLLWNVLGATLMLPDKHPLRIIQVYLTFGMGEEALDLEPGPNRGLLLFAGSVLYLATGALFGILLQFILQGFFSRTGAMVRALICAAFGAGLWALNFLVLLPWIQPAAFGGNWIADETPWYVGLSTHLVFSMSYFLFSSWGRFDRARVLAPWVDPARRGQAEEE